ncbi:MAG: hypothetical protein HFF62_06145 [Oscillospiraceae bacterium]|nr:hypothetical protein [Oscillospiraceae bacterium]
MTKHAAATSESQVPDRTVTEPVPAPTENISPQKNSEKAGGPPSGFYIHIGPTIPGLIQANTIYRGSREHALTDAKEAIEKYPLIKTLIVPGDYLPVARLKIKTTGNALHANYVRLAAAAKEARKV